ncbi:sulfate transporter ychM, partial [Yersinia pestis PY-58]
GSILGRWWRYKWITFHPSLTVRHGDRDNGWDCVGIIVVYATYCANDTPE